MCYVLFCYLRYAPLISHTAPQRKRRWSKPLVHIPLLCLSKSDAAINKWQQRDCLCGNAESWENDLQLPFNMSIKEYRVPLRIPCPTVLVTKIRQLAELSRIFPENQLWQWVNFPLKNCWKIFSFIFLFKKYLCKVKRKSIVESLGSQESWAETRSP